MTVEELLQQPFGTLPDLIRAHAVERPDAMAVIDATSALTYREFDARLDRVAAALQRDGLEIGEVGAICASASVAYATVFLGLLRAGCTVSPLAPSSTPESLAAMVEDCGARILFLDREVEAALEPVSARLPRLAVSLDGSGRPGSVRGLAGRTGRPAAAGGGGARRRLQHHLFLGHHG